MSVDRIEQLAAEAGRADLGMKSAIEAERGARELLLARVIDAMRPHLWAVVSYGTMAEDGVAVKDRLAVATRRLFAWKGVLVAGVQNPDIVRELARAMERVEVVRMPVPVVEVHEKLEGRGLYLSEGGAFIGVLISGTIARDGSYAWKATDVSMTTADVVRGRWPVGEIVSNLAEELEAQVAGKQKSTRRSDSAARAMREAAKILDGVR